MTARAANPLDLAIITRYLDRSLQDPDSVIGSVLPSPLAAGAMVGWRQVLPGLFGLGGRLRAYLEEHQGRLRSAALVYGGPRPEWVVLALVAAPDPDGMEGAFRLLSGMCASAARAGVHRVFGVVPDPETGGRPSTSDRSRETFFQAGFYSYTRETWYLSRGTPLARPSRDVDARTARSVDAHDLFRFYAMTTPHAVQRAEQLSVPDFDVGQRAGAFDPPHLVGGNPFAMRRTATLLDADAQRPRGFAVSFRGLERHPHLCKVRTTDGDVDRARDLLRVAAKDLPPGRPLVAPVRSYEEHVARALLAEGFRETATAMLFVKELAVRIEEPAFAPVVVR